MGAPAEVIAATHVEVGRGRLPLAVARIAGAARAQVVEEGVGQADGLVLEEVLDLPKMEGGEQMRAASRAVRLGPQRLWVSSELLGDQRAARGLWESGQEVFWPGV